MNIIERAEERLIVAISQNDKYLALLLADLITGYKIKGQATNDNPVLINQIIDQMEEIKCYRETLESLACTYDYTEDFWAQEIAKEALTLTQKRRITK